MSSAGVILLHGIGRTGASMQPLAARLVGAGYDTLALDYPSRARDLSALADWLQARAGAWCEAQARVHLVTHSMGGLVARVFVARYRPAHLGRVVMLAPPNQGSEIADLLRPLRAYRAAFGPAGAQLGTRRDAATSAMLGPADFELGVIAGTRALDPAGWLLLPKPNDGKVSVEATRLAGMADHLILPATHTFIMRHPAAIAATLAFLRNGRFRP